MAEAPHPERHRSGRHFLQLPGPSTLPERVLRAMHRPLIDHRGPEFSRLARALLERLRALLGTEGSVFVYPASGSGGWEAALANTLSPGDRVLAFDHGHFARKWVRVATKLGLEVQLHPGDWRRPPDPETVREVLSRDEDRRIRAVLAVHNETSTGVVTDVAALREAMDRADHPALLMVDAVSSLACMPYRQDPWGVDVTVAASQKGLMLPPGLAIVGAAPRALAAAADARLPRSYWDWGAMADFNARGFFPYTPATSLLFGLEAALDLLDQEGLEAVFRRHARHAAATRRAVEAWGLETVCADPSAHSASVTALLLPDGYDADAFRWLVLERWDMALGKGLGDLEGRAFRIGHLGDLNDLTLLGALAGVEMGLAAAGIPHREGGLRAAMAALGEGGARGGEEAPGGRTVGTAGASRVADEPGTVGASAAGGGDPGSEAAPSRAGAGSASVARPDPPSGPALPGGDP